jgi:hypothetical protein
VRFTRQLIASSIYVLDNNCWPARTRRSTPTGRWSFREYRSLGLSSGFRPLLDPLQCLDRPHRLAYVLGDIMELSGPEAAEVLEINPALFRKRLQLAREQVRTFLRAHCGLVSDTAPCQCNRHVPATSVDGAADVHPLQFARRATSFEEARALVRQVDEARQALEVHRTGQPREASVDFAQQLLTVIDRSVAGGPPRS